jgi:hypothetical protein
MRPIIADRRPRAGITGPTRWPAPHVDGPGWRRGHEAHGAGCGDSEFYQRVLGGPLDNAAFNARAHNRPDRGYVAGTVTAYDSFVDPVSGVRGAICFSLWPTDRFTVELPDRPVRPHAFTDAEIMVAYDAMRVVRRHLARSEGRDPRDYLDECEVKGSPTARSSSRRGLPRLSAVTAGRRRAGAGAAPR